MTEYTGITQITGGQNLTIDSTIHMEGIVTIENGPDTKLEFKNKSSTAFLRHMVSMIAGNSWGAGNAGWWTPGARYFGLDCTFVTLGFDTTHPTTVSTSALTSPIGLSPGTKPAASNRVTSQNGNEFYMTFLYSFAPGTVSGTVGEIGHWWPTSAQAMITTCANQYCNGTTSMNSRLSVADGEMTPWTIDPMYPVTITWAYRFAPDGKTLNSFCYNLINACINGSEYGIYWQANASNYYLMSYNWGGQSTFMVIGQDTSHGNNAATTTKLYNQIGSGEGQRPNSQTLSCGTVTPGVYQIVWLATWNPGSIAPNTTLGEVAMYLGGKSYLRGFSFNENWDGAYCAARINSSDGHFESRVIDSTKSLTIAWTMTFSF